MKLGFPIEASAEWAAQRWTALAPGREGVVLNRLGVAGAAYGVWERGTWNVQPWHEGTSLYDAWKPCRDLASSKEPDQRQALSSARALTSLHARGWVHGDIQPAHVILGPDTTHLIDLALARGEPIPSPYDFPFRGCLVHYESPELSRAVLATGEATPTRASDVYALGASLFISATGRRAVAYPDDAPRSVQRHAVATGSHRPVHLPGKLGELIAAMLSPAPSDRPTAAEVCAALE